MGGVRSEHSCLFILGYVAAIRTSQEESISVSIEQFSWYHSWAYFAAYMVVCRMSELTSCDLLDMIRVSDAKALPATVVLNHITKQVEVKTASELDSELRQTLRNRLSGYGVEFKVEQS